MGGELIEPTQARPRILVVDDEEPLLEMIRLHLGDSFDVVALSDPIQAAEVVRSTRFDIYLFDICMDPLPGLELLIQALSVSCLAPVFLMTGAPSVEHAVEALRAGATDLILKPLDFAALRDRLIRAHRKAQTQDRSIPPGRLAAVQEALTRAVEAKDPSTFGHGDRVRGVCRLLGREIGLTGSDLEVLDQAAALHDVGKIGIPDSVLCKPGPLTVEEFKTIQQHPEIGARILEPLVGLDEVRRCVIEHHERWDGTGYPHRLRDEEVSLPGRVLILAEVFDALAHPRCYKPAWSLSRIERNLREGAGRHFDPELVPCFLSLVEREPETLFGRTCGASGAGA